MNSDRFTPCIKQGMWAVRDERTGGLMSVLEVFIWTDDEATDAGQNGTYWLGAREQSEDVCRLMNGGRPE